jgi:peroxiredoxin
VAAYDRFRNQNFTVVGVSLDKTKDAWINAIHEDGLHWSHISDLAFWNSQAVATYKFDGIPYNILIDPGGTVIAEGLRGEPLSSKLSEVLK